VQHIVKQCVFRTKCTDKLKRNKEVQLELSSETSISKVENKRTMARGRMLLN